MAPFRHFFYIFSVPPLKKCHTSSLEIFLFTKHDFLLKMLFLCVQDYDILLAIFQWSLFKKPSPIWQDAFSRHFVPSYHEEMFYSLKNYLEDHIRIHVERKFYSCIQCNKTFFQQSEIKVYKRNQFEIIFSKKCGQEGIIKLRKQKQNFIFKVFWKSY